MGKTRKYLNKQLKNPNFKKDAEDCIKIMEWMRKVDNDHVWESKFNIFIQPKFKGFPTDERVFEPTIFGITLLKGISIDDKVERE